MANTFHTGPFHAFGRARSGGGIGGSQDYNPDEPGVCFAMRGWGMLDTRQPFTYQPGQSETEPFYGYGPGSFVVIDQAPSAAAANNIAASQAITAGTPMTLVTTTAAGITVGASVVNATTGQLVTGLLAIDVVHGGVPFGTNKAVNVWDPTSAISRALVVAGLTGTALISGYDLYGYPMTQLVSSTGSLTTLKAFKYVASVVPQTAATGSAVTVGTTDLYGFPLAVASWPYIEVYWNNVLQTAVTGTGVAFNAAVTTTPTTNLTGDVRGTYNIGSTTPSNGTIVLWMAWKPRVSGLLTQAGVWGVLQS